MKIFTTIFFSILFITYMSGLSSCTKPSEPELIPITTSGKNTMGFKINGKVVNIRGLYTGQLFDLEGVKWYKYNGGIVQVFSSSEDPKYTLGMFFSQDSLDINNSIEIDEKIYRREEIEIVDNGPLGGNSYVCDMNNIGIINIMRLDENVIAGTFHFDAINKETEKVISVTDGRFDIRR